MRTLRPTILVLLLLPAMPSFSNLGISGSLGRPYEVSPGKTYEGTIEVTNPDASAQEIKLYQTDYSFSADGSIVYGEPGRLPRSNARWITVSPQRVTIPAGEGATIHYTIQVPPDDTLRGTYWSIIMVEPVAPGSPESGSYDPTKVTVGIREVLRYGVQIETTRGSTGSRNLRFSQVLLQADTGSRLLVVDLENTGERSLQPSLWAELYDGQGGFVGRFDGGAHRLYPGTAARFRVELRGVSNATYKALIVADCGGDDVFGANVSLVLQP
jgi:hypothetical protein